MTDAFSRAVERRLARMRVIARLCTAVGALMLVALGVVGLGASVVPRVMGMQSYAIISGSMEPAYPTGSLVYAEPAEGAALQAGDVLARPGRHCAPRAGERLRRGRACHQG